MDNHNYCKGCKNSYRVLLKHLSGSKNCRDVYTKEEINKMRNAAKKRTASKKLQKQRKEYDPEKRAKRYEACIDAISVKKAQYYEKNKYKILLKKERKKKRGQLNMKKKRNIMLKSIRKIRNKFQKSAKNFI